MPPALFRTAGRVNDVNIRRINVCEDLVFIQWHSYLLLPGREIEDGRMRWDFNWLKFRSFGGICGGFAIILGFLARFIMAFVLSSNIECQIPVC